MKNEYSSRRTGFTVVEIIGATFLLTVAMLVFLKTAYAVIGQQRTLQEKRIAIDQLENVLELISHDPEMEMKVAENRLPGDASRKMVQNALPDGEIVLQSQSVDSENGVFLLQGTVSWSDGEKRPRRSVSMVRLFTSST